MGLDMYLTGESYLVHDWENPENNRTEGGFRIKGYELDLGYWRKHPDLHGFIVETFADGIDECQRIELSAPGILKVIEAIRQERLPKTDGFFFGESTNDQEQRDEAIGTFQKAAEWLQNPEPGKWKSVVYQASW
ncbi:phosphoglycerate kinase [Haloferula helveola]|uniref:Phosphoglycerate kinase n=2 Tax=Haloferula helveola TaxID=490095 RepID=A0ABM7RDH6_9BACT|nr:phosphoglycerate kinase [Haloferula helveola]